MENWEVGTFRNDLVIVWYSWTKTLPFSVGETTQKAIVKSFFSKKKFFPLLITILRLGNNLALVVRLFG